jgi:hypothetical protein
VVRSVYKIVVGKLEGKRPLGRHKRRWHDNIIMDLREAGNIVVDSIHVALLNTVMKLRVP